MKHLKSFFTIILTIVLIWGCKENPIVNFSGSDETSNDLTITKLSKNNPLLKGLISWWPGEDNANDIIGGYDGILMNGTGFNDGKVGRAFQFDWDGWDNYAATYVKIEGIKRVDNLKKFTMEMWIKLENENGVLANRVERFMTIAPPEIEKASIRHDGGDNNAPMAGQLHFFMRIDGELHGIGAENVLQYGVFQHVAATYDGKVMRLYCDGQEVASAAYKGFVAKGNSLVRLSSPDEPMSGLLDEASIYDRALSAKEIKAIFDAGASGK